MKSILGSKTFWLQILALVIVGLQYVSSHHLVPDNVIAGIDALVTLLCRLSMRGSIKCVLVRSANVFPRIPKPWFESRTIWVNAAALAGITIQGGSAQLSPELTAAILAIVNIILRYFTKRPIGAE